MPCCHFESTKQQRSGATDGNKGFRKLLNSKQACNYSRMFPTSDTDGFIFITSVKTEGQAIDYRFVKTCRHVCSNNNKDLLFLFSNKDCGFIKHPIFSAVKLKCHETGWCEVPGWWTSYTTIIRKHCYVLNNNS